ncbi:MAG: 23S rRNA (uracil(1939)-C(5))-methyltransferase RlmD [Bacteroidetes bacterium]|nr:23S rRNA (uracil(1939)-C(5))-methyltransferase RlmD [Bacteroidota bacterium]
MSNKQKMISGVEITAMASKGLGIGKVDGKVYFVEGAVPGDTVNVRVTTDKKKYAEGEIAELITASAHRTEPVCEHFGTCGGCKWQHIQYSEQLQYKTQIVEDALIRIGKLTIPEVKPITGSRSDYFYRNKLEFSFTDRRWLTQAEIDGGQEYDRRGVGFHVPGSFMMVLDVKKCWLQGDPSNAIRLAVRDFAIANDYTFFNIKTQEGLLRTMMIRTTSIGEIMVLVMFTTQDDEKIDALLGHLREQFPQITSLQYVINNKRNDTIYDLPTYVHSGKDHIVEQLGDYKFKVNPKSFFQTNSDQARVLYDVAKEFADLKPTDVVYDLYTGVGSIALYVSGLCKNVVGIEQVEAAIEDAKENAELNGVTNCAFYAGDVRMVLKPEFIAANGRPDVVITDPPRAGMHEDVVKTLLELAAPRIVYVSCNPATQARDLELLAAKYDIKKIQPVDMFPQTTHIENVAVLELR